MVVLLPAGLITLLSLFLVRFDRGVANVVQSLLGKNRRISGFVGVQNVFLVTTRAGQILHAVRRMLIGTHSGTFHCDEALACFFLRQLPEYKEADILRTRDDEKLKDCDIVVDVGGTYDPSSFRFDHHQKTFVDTLSSVIPAKPWKTRLSSAGLVYAHFGKRVLAVLTGKPENDPFVDNLFDIVYVNFVEEVDAVDNGVPIVDGEQVYFPSTTLSGRVRNLQPSWNSGEKYDLDVLFKDAVKLTGAEFTSQVEFLADCLEQAAKTVPGAFHARRSVHESGKIMGIDDDGTGSWKYYLKSVEESENASGAVKFVLGKDGVTGYWRISGVPAELPHGSELRAKLPEAWRGSRDSKLQSLTGEPSAVFVGFDGEYALCKSQEGAIKLAASCSQ